MHFDAFFYMCSCETHPGDTAQCDETLFERTQNQMCFHNRAFKLWDIHDYVDIFYPETEEKYAFLEPPTSFYPCSGTSIYHGDHALKLQNISVFSLCNRMSQGLNSITGYTQLKKVI